MLRRGNPHPPRAGAQTRSLGLGSPPRMRTGTARPSPDTPAGLSQRRSQVSGPELRASRCWRRASSSEPRLGRSGSNRLPSCTTRSRRSSSWVTLRGTPPEVSRWPPAGRGVGGGAAAGGRSRGVGVLQEAELIPLAVGAQRLHDRQDPGGGEGRRRVEGWRGQGRRESRGQGQKGESRRETEAEKRGLQKVGKEKQLQAADGEHRPRSSSASDPSGSEVERRLATPAPRFPGPPLPSASQSQNTLPPSPHPPGVACPSEPGESVGPPAGSDL